MATITTLNSGDTGSTSRGVINTNFTNLNSDKAETSALSSYLNKSTDDLDDINAGTTNKHFTATLESKLNGIEAGADVTDATNVAAAGAVMNTGNETIAGIKTFSSSPIVPAPTTDLQAATKKYVDDNAGGAPEGTAVKSTGETGGTKFLREDGDGTCSWQTVAAGTGDVVGPASATDNAIARFDTTTGKLIQNSGLSIDDNNDLFVPLDWNIYNNNTNGRISLNAVTGTGSVEVNSDEITLNAPNVFFEGSINDNNGNELLKTSATASAVNELTIKNNITANAPEIQATGGDTNISLNLVPKGTGTIQANGVDVVTTTGTQTLTNKTLTSPKINEDVAVTATATELNVLDGIPATLTATELGYVDGVTSAIQTQLNAKAPTASPTFTGTVTLPIGLTGVIRTDSGVVSVDTDVTDIVAAASDTAAGKVELATSAEIDTSTDATRAISPDSLAGSKFGKQPFGIVVFDGATALATGDGKAYIPITPKFNGMNIVSVGASLVGAASSSGTPTIQIARGRQSSATSAYTFTDVLSTRITIDASEYHSKDATTVAVIDTSADDLATGDILRIDVDVAGTGAQGLLVFGEAQMP